MSYSARFSSRLWLLAPILAIGFLSWVNWVRLQRIDFVNSLGKTGVALDPNSPTGYARGIREHIAPEQNHESYEWILETQQMFARGEWRVRTVDQENAPFGRETHGSSLYRWWLGLLAWCDHFVSGRPMALAVERAAWFADPVLHLLVVVGTAAFVARVFGVMAAVFASLALATLFPWTGAFLAGAPDHHGLAYALAMWSVLLVLAGVRASNERSRGVVRPDVAGSKGSVSTDRPARRWFLLAGIAGGVGLWLDLSIQLVTATGIALGALLTATLEWKRSRKPDVGVRTVMPWRVWGWSGAASCLAAYLLEYAPSHFSLGRTEVIHPVYAIGWLGIGELLERANQWATEGRQGFRGRDITWVVLAALACALVPISLVLGDGQGWLTHDALASRLSALPGGIVARNLAAWFGQYGPTPMAWAAILPLLLVVPALWCLCRRANDTEQTLAIALALGPLLAALVVAAGHLRWWSQVDATLVALLVATLSTPRKAQVAGHRGTPWGWMLGTAVALVPGIVVSSPRLCDGRAPVLTEVEADALMQREFAQWLTRQSPVSGAGILASAERTTALCYHGGLRGLGTLAWENRDGVTAAVRIASATSPDEALELIQRRRVTHIVMPSWDAALDDYARLGSSSPSASFVAALHRWSLPPWVRAVPYQLPKIKGWEGRVLRVFEVVEEQDAATANGRLGEYFVEMGMIDVATAFRSELEKYQSDAGALAALAQIEIARGDKAAFGRLVDTLQHFVSGDYDPQLPFDRQVSLAIVFAQAQRFDVTRTQVERCLNVFDEAQLHVLTTRSLFRLLVLAKGFGLSVPDEAVRAEAMRLLPPELAKELR